MKVSECCKSYFDGFQEVCNFRKNDSTTNVLAVLKTLSYFTVVIPLGFAAAYGAASLCGRVSKNQDLFSHDKSICDKAKETLLKNNTSVFSSKLTDVESSNLLAYITKILNSSEFQSDPGKYMKSWKQKYLRDWEQRRGGAEEFRIPEDQAILFFAMKVLPKLISKTQVNIPELEEKAKSFVKEREYSSEIAIYIHDVLTNPFFSTRSLVFFMNKWKA